MSGDGDVADELAQRRDAVVERAERVREREAPLLADHGPLLHALAGEDRAGERLGVDDDQPLTGQQQVLDLDVPAHAVRHEHVLQPLDRDGLERLRDLRTPACAATAANSTSSAASTTSAPTPATMAY